MAGAGLLLGSAGRNLGNELKNERSLPGVGFLDFLTTNRRKTVKNTSPAMQALREKIKQYRVNNPLKFPAKKPATLERDFGYFSTWNCQVGRLRNVAKVTPVVSGKCFFIRDEPLPF